jgi:hypothetical protein
MGSVVAYNHRSDVPDSSGGSGSGGGDVDDILRRLGNVETSVGALRTQVDTIAATIPHLATAKSVDAILATLPHLATAASVAAMETRIIKWFIATAATLTALATTVAFSIAKLVH